MEKGMLRWFTAPSRSLREVNMRLLRMAITGALLVMALSGLAQAVHFKDGGVAIGGHPDNCTFPPCPWEKARRGGYERQLDKAVEKYSGSRLQEEYTKAEQGAQVCSRAATPEKGTAMVVAEGVKPSGPTVHCDLCPTYCTRTICDLNGCRDEQYICGWYSCNCSHGG